MSDVHAHDLHRHDDDGGHLWHPERLDRAHRRMMRTLKAHMEACANLEDLSVMHKTHVQLQKAYREWQSHH